MSSDAHYELGDVRRVYSVWGKHPALYWAQDVFSFLGRHREIRGATVDEMRLRPGDRVLEVGCGNGRNLGYLRDAVGAAGHVVGFDYTSEMLAEAQHKIGRAGWKNVELHQGDAATVQWEPQSFDAVLGLMSFSAMPDHISALRHAWDALRPGGVLAVTDGQSFQGGAMSVLNPLLDRVVAPLGTWHPRRHLPDDMFELFGNVSVRTHNAGTFFVARSVKPERRS